MKPLPMLCRLTLLLALAAAPIQAAPDAAGAISGKVVETMNAASYTYVLIDTGAKNPGSPPRSLR